MQRRLTLLYPNPSPREIKIEQEIQRLALEPIEIRPFMTVASYLDAFRWDGQLVDLRTKKKSAIEALPETTTHTEPPNGEVA